MDILKVRGNPTEIGRQHGSAYRDAIRACVDIRMNLCLEFEDIHGVRRSRNEILDLVSRCCPVNRDFAPDLYAEVEAIARATDRSVEEILMLNGYTDFCDLLWDHEGENEEGCTAFIVTPERAKNQSPLIGQTWDISAHLLPYALTLEVHPENSLPCIVFSLAGCVGMIGMNGAGICVGINNLHARKGVFGVFWPLVVRKILQQNNIEDALQVLRDAPLAGAHNYVLMDRKGKAYNVEQLPGVVVEREVKGAYAHTNHCLESDAIACERKRPESYKKGSLIRHDQANALLAAPQQIGIEDLERISRYEEPGSVYSINQRPGGDVTVATCGACFMRPQDGLVRVIKGIPADGEYISLRLAKPQG